MGVVLVLVIISAVVIGVLVGQRLIKKQDGTSTPWPTTNGKACTTRIEPLLSFDWQSTRPAQLRPFKPIYHITMALQSSSPEDLIVLDSNYKGRIEKRRGVIANNPETAMGTVPIGGGDGKAPLPAAKAAVDELYNYLIASYLPARYPSIFIKTSTMTLHNLITGNTFPCAPPADPLEAFRILGETVEDDLFLLQEENVTSNAKTADGPTNYPDTSHRLIAFLCCFPSGFDPSSKLGLLLRDIHGPVPAYDKIGPSMERFFSRLEVGKSVRRLNWSVQTHTELFVPRGNHVHEGDEVELDADVDIAEARLRVECQTLTRLPQTKAVLFSFKTYLFPLQELKEDGVGPELADAIEGLQEGNAPGMWTYKGGVRWGKSVCAYLRA